jgi:energy-coupling factor transporter transmembrane protein EcfT
VADLTAFTYQPGASILHRLDVRLKLALMAAASLASLRLDFAGIGLMALPLLAAAAGCCRSVRIRSSELRWMGLLLGFVFAARVLSADGTPAFSVLSLDITREGLREGALVGLRLALVFLAGTLLMATTRPAEVKAGVQWFLQPLPFVPAERVGTMLGLLVRFIPVIFEEVSRVSDAQRARAVENHRNPLRRAVKLGVPIMRGVFERSDRLALAMEARCYSERRSAPALRAAPRDWLLFGMSCGWLAVVLAV